MHQRQTRVIAEEKEYQESKYARKQVPDRYEVCHNGAEAEAEAATPQKPLQIVLVHLKKMLHALMSKLGDHYAKMEEKHEIEYNGSHVQWFATLVPSRTNPNAVDNLARLLSVSAVDETTEAQWAEVLSGDWLAAPCSWEECVRIYNAVATQFDTIDKALLDHMNPQLAVRPSGDDAKMFRATPKETYIRCVRDLFHYLQERDTRYANEALVTLAVATRALHASCLPADKKTQPNLALQQCAAIWQRAGCALMCRNEKGEMRDLTCQLPSFQKCYMPSLMWPGLQMVALVFGKSFSAEMPEELQIATRFGYATSDGKNTNRRQTHEATAHVYKFQTVGSFFWWVCQSNALSFEHSHIPELATLFQSLASIFYPATGAHDVHQHLTVKCCSIPNYACCSTQDGTVVMMVEDEPLSERVDAFHSKWLELWTKIDEQDRFKYLTAVLDLWPMLHAQSVQDLWTAAVQNDTLTRANMEWRSLIIDRLTNIPVVPFHFSPQMEVTKAQIVASPMLNLHKKVLFGDQSGRDRDPPHEILMGGFDNLRILDCEDLANVDTTMHHFSALTYAWRCAWKFPYYWLPQAVQEMFDMLLASKRGVFRPHETSVEHRPQTTGDEWDAEKVELRKSWADKAALLFPYYVIPRTVK